MFSGYPFCSGNTFRHRQIITVIPWIIPNTLNAPGTFHLFLSNVQFGRGEYKTKKHILAHFILRYGRERNLAESNRRTCTPIHVCDMALLPWSWTLLVTATPHTLNESIAMRLLHPASVCVGGICSGYTVGKHCNRLLMTLVTSLVNLIQS